MAHIFISYSRKDSAMVQPYIKALRSRGIEVWQDVLGNTAGIPYSVNWFLAIEDALYRSSGAVIFHSAAWETSQPCAKENEIIQRISLPCHTVYLDEQSDFTSAVQETIARCRQINDQNENKLRHWMVYNCYRMEKGFEPEIQKCRKLRATIRHLKALAACKQLSQREHYAQKDPIVAAHLNRLLRTAHRKLGFYQLAKLVLIIFCLVCGFAVFAGVYHIPRAIQAGNEEIYTRYIYHLSRKAKDVQPFYAAEGIFYNENLNYLYTSQTLLLDILNKSYPTHYYKKDSADANHIAQLDAIKSSANYTLFTDQNASRLFLRENETGSIHQLPAESTIENYAFSEDGLCLAYCSYYRAYFADLSNPFSPQVLIGNNENIQKVIIKKRKIYAVCDTGNVMEWNYPYAQKQVSRLSNPCGAVATDANGQFVAAYDSDNGLILNRKNRQTVLPLRGYATYEKTTNPEIALSPNGNMVAAVAQNTANNMLYLIVADTVSAKILLEHPLNCQANTITLAFSADGKSVIYGDSAFHKLCSVEIASGKYSEKLLDIITTKGNYNFIPFGISCTPTHIYVSSTSGTAKQFNYQLEETGNKVFLSNSYNSPLKQFVADDSTGFLYASYRGSNVMFRDKFSSVDSTQQDAYLFPFDNKGVNSSTAVAISSDHRFVARGFSNGTVVAYAPFNDPTSYVMVYENQSICESILGLSFSSDNNKVFALGASGTVYTLNMSREAKLSKNEDSTACYQLEKDRFLRIYDRFKAWEITAVDLEPYQSKK